MKNVLKTITDYKLHEIALVFKIPYLTKDNKICIDITYSFLSLNEKEVIEEMLHIQNENPNFQRWILYQEFKKK